MLEFKYNLEKWRKKQKVIICQNILLFCFSLGMLVETPKMNMMLYFIMLIFVIALRNFYEAFKNKNKPENKLPVLMFDEDSIIMKEDLLEAKIKTSDISAVKFKKEFSKSKYIELFLKNNETLHIVEFYPVDEIKLVLDEIVSKTA